MDGGQEEFRTDSEEGKTVGKVEVGMEGVCLRPGVGENFRINMA